MTSGLRFIDSNPFISSYNARLESRARQERADAEAGEFRRRREIDDATDAAARDAANKGGGLRQVYSNLGTAYAQIPGAGGQAIEAMGKAQEIDDASQEEYLRLAKDDPDAADSFAAAKDFQVPDHLKQYTRTSRGRQNLNYAFGLLKQLYGNSAENGPNRAKAFPVVMQAIQGGADISSVIPTLPPPATPRGPEGPISYGPLEERPGLGWGQMDSRGQWHSAGGQSNTRTGLPTGYRYNDQGVAEKIPGLPDSAFGGQGGDSAVFDRKVALWQKVYEHQGLAPEEAQQRALEVASGTKRYTRTELYLEAQKAAHAELSGAFGTMEQKAAQAKQRTDEIFQQLLQVENAGGAAGDGAAPVQEMQGAGTEDDPFTPVTADDFDRIQPGEIYVDPGDGQPYRKK